MNTSVSTNKAGALYSFLALLTVSVWGVTFVSTKILLGQGMSPTDIFISRFAIAYICIIFFSHSRLFASSVRDEMLLALAGLTGGSLYFLAENSALGITFASNVSLLICMAPVFTMILGSAVLKDKIKPIAWGGSLLALAGVAAVVLNGSLNLGINPLGDFLTLTAALSWAVYTLLVKRLNSTYSNMFITRKVFFYGIVTAAAYAALSGVGIRLPLSNPGPVIANLLFLGVGASFACYMIWNVVVKALGPEKASNYIYLNPLVTILASSVILGEQLTPWTLIGAAAIITGVYLTSK